MPVVRQPMSVSVFCDGDFVVDPKRLIAVEVNRSKGTVTLVLEPSDVQVVRVQAPAAAMTCTASVVLEHEDGTDQRGDPAAQSGRQADRR